MVTGIVDFRAYAPMRGCMETVTSPPPEADRYAEKYHLGSADDLTMDAEQLVARLDGAGIDHMVLVGPGASNEDLAEYVRPFPERLSGIASISMSMGISAAIREIRHSHSLGLRLIGLGPLRDGFRSSDRRYYPVYSTCSELDMAVVIHTSSNLGRGMPQDLGRPLHLDQVATDFPELMIVASHGGWPWILEMVAVAWHHDNVYIEMSSHRALHMGKPGSGWEYLFNYGSGPLRDRLLWGSTSPYLGLERQLAETRQLPMSEDAMSNMLSMNPRELLGRLGIKVGVRADVDRQAG